MINHVVLSHFLLFPPFLFGAAFLAAFLATFFGAAFLATFFGAAFFGAAFLAIILKREML